MLDVRERYSNDATIVTYEDLLRSPGPILAETFRFLGVTDAPDIVARCIGQASFMAMSGGQPGRSGTKWIVLSQRRRGRLDVDADAADERPHNA
jgi:hypothetical protein